LRVLKPYPVRGKTVIYEVDVSIPMKGQTNTR
jgi:hypothetical protein